MFPDAFRFEFGSKLNGFIDTIVEKYGDQFENFSLSLTRIIVWFEGWLRESPWWVTLTIIGLIAYAGSRKVVPSLALMATGFLIGAMGLWDKAMQTLALMIVATSCTVMLGIPIGIVVARSQIARTIVKPLLDGMQTMPSFVYLIPAIMLFGLGKVPAILATVIYALPPLIRMTDLGLRMVDSEIVEASTSFGANSQQTLWGVQLPLALPTIMTGINQATMMALSMVVIASMIGARGLGEQVLLGIQRIDFGVCCIFINFQPGDGCN